MELWIRSQDREKLLKVNGLQYQNCKLEENVSVETNAILGFYGGFENDILGEYKTKERALEVLNEIQMLLQPIIEYKPVVQEEHNVLYPYKNFVKVDDNMKIKELSTFVYEMPAE